MPVNIQTFCNVKTRKNMRNVTALEPGGGTRGNNYTTEKKKLTVHVANGQYKQMWGGGGDKRTVRKFCVEWGKEYYRS
jgi:hypothetical protein